MGLIKAGVCIHLPDRGTDGKSHLHIVINDPVGHPKTVAMVSLSSTISADKTTVFQAGDHDFIDRETYVVYAWMQYKIVEVLEQQLSNNMSMRHRHNCSPEMLKRIQDGIFESPHVTPSALKYCRTALGHD